MPDNLIRRAGVWHFQRRVPVDFAELDKRGVVRQSTKIKTVDDPKGLRAGKVADQHNRVLEAYWKGLVDGQYAESDRRYQEARRRARAMGLEYMPAAEVATVLPIGDVLGRVERLTAAVARNDETTIAAALGGEARPGIKLSDLFDRFKAQVAADMQDMSPDQRRKWERPKVRAAKNLISVIGDKLITEISRDDALDFSEWWQARVLEENLIPGTANKDMGHLTRMFTVLDKRLRLGLPPIFAGMRLEGGVENTRPPFDPEYVRNKILAPGALATMNPEARRAMLLIMGTGMRPTEAVNLTRDTIVLGAEIPHVQIRADGRRMKTQQSRRDIPLVGVALAAAKAQPDGFPRYRDKASELSATVNKFLGEHDLRMDGSRTLYSFRHMFKDQLTGVEAEDSMIDALMGHKETGSKYGTGPSLALRLKYLQLIAFTAPAKV